MRKARGVLLLLALLALLGAHLHPQYRVSVEGAELPGCYSAAALRQGLRAAEEAAGEILRYEAKMPALERRLRLKLRPAGDDIPALTAALLRPVSGITLADAVYVNGVPLGTVADGERFCERLRDSTIAIADHTVQIRDVYNSHLEIKQNRIMTILTVVTTIFMPLTLIAGWYGMNFRYMPELDAIWGYPVIIFVSILIVVGSLLFFKKKKWL